MKVCHGSGRTVRHVIDGRRAGGQLRCPVCHRELTSGRADIRAADKPGHSRVPRHKG